MLKINYRVKPVKDDVDQLSEFIDLLLKEKDIPKPRFDSFKEGEATITFHIKEKYLTKEKKGE